MQPIIRMAEKHEAGLITDLVNIAYRSSHPSSWTDESAWVSGNRTSVDAVMALFADDSYLFVVVINNDLRGCMHLNVERWSGYLGMLTIHPVVQNQGLGKLMLDHVEQYSREKLLLNTLEMVVMIERKELMAFYLRRGYVRTGKVSPYPSTGYGTPKVPDLHIEVLQKVCN